MLREDYIIRIIRQAIQAIAKMAGLRAKGDHEEARRQADAAYDLLGVPADLAAVMDSAGLAELLRDPDKVRLMARLSQEEAELFKAAGDPLTATARYRRAAELVLEAHRAAPDAADGGLLQELFRHFPTGSLAPRYQADVAGLRADATSE
jgi:hypothetical protein